ncbi:sterile alpha motif domain-containing protein 9-like [Seriola lalandi dorsalis]|uniref:sterile alpha motif domain-containing protein 9-like n=1 Tax=Seriola lalandi dorsalis TaxID=1841481 RepID=UPI000C6F6DB7|nr:sterile alpha motif domain-containing protein 9-like [Seriola lalandi dorsalis]
MANGPALSTAKGGEIYLGSEIGDSLSLLDVLYANQFEGEFLDPALLEQTEENFYRGAPPDWLNFHISEQAESRGIGIPFIKRDGYDTLEQQIRQRRKRPGISMVKLFHQSGCGGTTLAMQVLWDLRKTFRCAVLTGSTSDITNVAKEVVHLFTAGSRGHQNTVLLLLNDEQILEKLRDSIMKTIAEQNVVVYMPVAILLSCVRKDEVVQSDHVALQRKLSDKERQKFNEKKKELSRRYSDKCTQFYGFNIMQTNFSPAYIKRECTVFSKVQRTNRPKKTQLAAFLSLLNAYVPGSYLLESQCLDFFKHDDFIHGDLSLEDRMQPFSHLIVTFQQDKTSERRVRMAHSMIAKQCTELMAEAGVNRSDTARNLLTCLCRDEVPPCLLGFVKDMLTKREMKKEENPNSSTEIKDEQERFSRLILDIQKREGNVESAAVLKVASKKMDTNPFFPQALARVYYIELKDYNKAEMWAKEAKKRDPQSSFVADTLGQVHKNHLNYLNPLNEKRKELVLKLGDVKSKELHAKPREILQLAAKAIEAFKHEEQLAENERESDMKGDGTTKVSHVFNNRGQFGYVQVCNLLFDLLVRQNETWRNVLTKNVSMCSVLKSLGDNKLYRFNDLINSLRDEVERKCDFFDKYLTYSKPDMKKYDVPYISKDTSDCYRKYVGDSPPRHVKEECAPYIQKLKQSLAETSAGILSYLDREYTEAELKEITTWWKEIYSSKDSLTALVNYILAHIMLINTGLDSPPKHSCLTAFRHKMPLNPKEAPELHMLALLLHWPTDSEDKCVFDLNQLVQHMHCSYEHAYKTYFRSRYLRPLFFIGKGQGLKRIVHRKVLEGLFLGQNKEEIQDWSNWSDENIFQDPKIQKHLLRVEGVVRNYSLYATVGGTEIEVDVNLCNSLWKPRQVSFYLGFTIRGPVAFSIQNKTTEKVEISEMDVSKPREIKPKLSACPDTSKGSSGMLKPSGNAGSGIKQDSSDWTKLTPEVNEVDEDRTYSLQSKAGHYECSVSTLRWVCKEKVRFRYQFCSWEDHVWKPACTDYMPAGPLLDITVTAGKLEEVHLPHWIDHNSKISDMFAILHVDTCGDFVEQGSEVTSSHVKLFQPVFSPRGVMIRTKLGIPVKVFCDVLIYKTRMEFLTLHVYMVPPDRDVQQKVERKETSYGSKIIPKPSPDKSLQMLDHFYLTADTDTAVIQPDKLKLRFEIRNYFEVFIRDAGSDFILKLKSKQKRNSENDTLWICTIRKGDYQNQSTDHEEGQHFVDRHRTALIKGVRDTGAILDKLMDEELISNETYDAVRALTTPQDQMREILRFVSSAGRRSKDAFYQIIKGMKNLKHLISELQGSR